MTVSQHDRDAFRGRWRGLVDAALHAADNPGLRSAELARLAKGARGWVMPAPGDDEALICATLVWAARAFGQQITVKGRLAQAPGLACYARLVGQMLAITAPGPDPGEPTRRFRADIDG